jgi:hypothetical protein
VQKQVWIQNVIKLMLQYIGWETLFSTVSIFTASLIQEILYLENHYCSQATDSSHNLNGVGEC